MKKGYRHRDTCRLCGSDKVEMVLSLTPAPPVDAFVPAEKKKEPQPVFPIDLYLCLACGHAQLLDVVDPEILFGHYIYETTSSPGLSNHFKKYADEIFGFLSPPRNSLAVDIGSNDGTLLRFFKAHGMRVLGVDPAPEIGRLATESGVPTLTAFFAADVARRIVKEHGAASLVTANNVFAHADDLGGMLDGVRDALAADGVFVFEVSYVVDMLQKTLFDLIYHEHLCYHAVKPLDRFMKSHGMELIDLLHNESKGGTLRGFAQRAKGPGKRNPVVDEYIKNENEKDSNGLQAYKNFAADVESLKMQIGRLIEKIREEGKTIAGYGAAAAGTVLMYHFGLTEVLDFLADDNPKRQGLFSPGAHVPVLSSQALYEKKPDYVIVLAWRYFDQILKKHRNYLNQGGHFIIPLPLIQVV